MKNIKYIIVMFFSVLLSVSCNSDDDNGSDINDTALIGSWVASETDEGVEIKVTLTFNANLTGNLIIQTTVDGETETETDPFSWSTNGNKLTIESSSELPEVLTYSISGNRLTITDSDNFSTVLTRL